MDGLQIKIGDMVKFFVYGERGQKVGQVISIEGENGTAFVEKDLKAYTVPLESMKRV